LIRKEGDVLLIPVVDTICSSEAFGVVRNISAFRLAGMTKGQSASLCSVGRFEADVADYILLSSDSGRLSIIEFVVNPTPHFESLFQEVYGKTGTR
jgi:splicing factor 3B subunit 3